MPRLLPLLVLPLLLAFTPAARAADQTRVLVLPFAPMTTDKTQAWIGPAIQQNVVAELGKISALAPVAFRTTNNITSTDVAGNLGRSYAGRLVVTGAYQIVDVRIRITAQITDAATNESVGTAKATGFLSDLLTVEDDLAAQIRTLIAPPTEPPAPAPAANDPVPAPVQLPPQPQVAPTIIYYPVVINTPQYPPLYNPTIYSPGYAPYTYPAYGGYYGGGYHRGGHYGGYGHGYYGRQGYGLRAPQFSLISSQTYLSASTGLATVLPPGSAISPYTAPRR